MSVRIALNGTLALAGGQFTFAPAQNAGAENGGELKRVQSLDIEFVLLSEFSSSKAQTLRVEISRDASQAIPEDTLASRLQFGQGERAEEQIIPVQILLINDQLAGAAALIGTFDITKGQVMATEPSDDAGPPRERVVIHGYEWQYINNIGGNQLMSTDNRVVPTKAFGVA